MSKPLYIYGAGGLGLEIQAMIKAMPEWHFGGFFDDSPEMGSRLFKGQYHGGLPQLLTTQDSLYVVLAIGDPMIKQKLDLALRGNRAIKFATLVHPRATLLDEDSVQMNVGCILTAGAVLTTSIKLGRHVFVNLNTTIGHSTTIGDYCSIMPGANLSGEVTLGAGVLIGSGANLLNKVKIEDGVRVGAGAVVTKNVTKGQIVVGVPARPLIKK